MVIFIELVQYGKNLGGKSRKNLVEHQIIKMIRKFNSINCLFLHPIVKIRHSVCLQCMGCENRTNHAIKFSYHFCYLNHSTQNDYILYRKSFRKAVNDVKVIPTEECVQQHNLVICDFTVCIPSAKKRKLTPHICTWKLREPAVSKDFQDTFKDKVAAFTPVQSADDVEDVWSKLLHMRGSRNFRQGGVQVKLTKKS